MVDNANAKDVKIGKYTNDADEVIKAEKRHIRKSDGASTEKKEALYGLALSGGGIRCSIAPHIDGCPGGQRFSHIRCYFSRHPFKSTGRPLHSGSFGRCGFWCIFGNFI